MSAKKELFEELSNGCSMYEPCPLCFKCTVKASHLYIRCETCPLEFCGHSHKQRAMMIRRENFGITVTNETGEKFKQASEMCQCNEEKKENDESS